MSLHSKMAEAMLAIGHIPKKGHNNFFNYDYVREEDVVEAVRNELAKRNVAVYIGSRLVETREWQTPKGKPTLITHVQVEITFADGESDEKMTVTSAGTGDDSSDKGTYKAITGAVKYALMKTFLVPTGDDPEQEVAEAKAPRGKRGVERVADPGLPVAPLSSEVQNERIIQLGRELSDAIGHDAAQAAYREERVAAGGDARHALTEEMAGRIIAGLELRLSLAKDSAGPHTEPMPVEGSGGAHDPPSAAAPKPLTKAQKGVLAKLREELVGLVGGVRADEVWFELLGVYEANAVEALTVESARLLEASLRLEVRQAAEFVVPPSVQQKLAAS